MFKSRKKYIRLIKEVFPQRAQDSDMNARNLDKLVAYASSNSAKLAKIGAYLEHRIRKKFLRREFG
jgi:hypothetical protein